MIKKILKLSLNIILLPIRILLQLMGNMDGMEGMDN